MSKIRRTVPLTAERARELLIYDPKTGALTWRIDRGRCYRAGSPAGRPKGSSGYIQVGIDGVNYLAHRVIWLLVKGAWPVLEIDHKDRVKDHNAWTNLRQASRGANVANIPMRKDNTSGFRGVRMVRPGKWRAIIRIATRARHLGYFPTAEEAASAYAAAAARNFGPFQGEQRAFIA